MAEVIEEQQELNPHTAKKSRVGLWFGIFITLSVVLLAGAGFYFMQQLRSSQDTENSQDAQKLIEVDKQMNLLHEQLSTLQSQFANMNAEMTGKDNHFTQTLADFSQLHNEKLDNTRKELESSIVQVQRQLGKTRGDWLIADAEYLLSVANQRLHLMGDINTTREALEAADQRLRESGDAAVYKVREQITKELIQLNSVTTPDIVGMYSTVQLLKERSSSLSVFLPYSGKEPTNLEQSAYEKTLRGEEQTTLSEQGHELLNEIAQQLEGYVVIRHTEQPVKAILTPEQVDFIREQLSVKLEMIKVALIQQNDSLFQTNIADAKQWLLKNFSEDKETKLFAAELDKLSGIQLRAQLPDISGSLKMLKDVSKLRLETDKAIQNATEPAAAQPQPEAAPQ